MNTLSRFIEPLGWSLLHFLWQGAALALLLMVFLRLARRCAPQIRYAASGVTLLLMLASAAGTVWWQIQAAAGVDEGPATPAARAPAIVMRENVSPKETPAAEPPALLPVTTAPLPAFVPDRAAAPAQPDTEPAPAAASLAERLRPALPWLVGLWAVGVILFSLRLMNGWRLVRRWRASGGVGVPAEWTARFAALCARMRISRPVQLLASAVLTVPVVIGWLKPVVLVPAGLFSGIPAAQLEAILAHELAHVRRCDYLVNLLQTAVETVLFYHPAVWWVSARLREEREHCCDDAAASLEGDAIAYARALTTLEGLRALPAAAAGVSAAGGSLLQRVRRLAGLPQERAGVAWPLGILTLAAVAASLAFTLPRSEAGELSGREKTPEISEGLTPLTEKEAPLISGDSTGTGSPPARSASPAAPPENPPKMGVARAPLEGELKKLAFGETHASGMRAAWAFDPPQEAYALGSLIKCRVVFHNNGRETVSFQTDAWHQADTWKVKNAAGQEVKVKTVWYSGITPRTNVRLQPGEIFEVPAHGLGIGPGKFEEAYSAGTIGAEIAAKEGDVLTCQWIVQLDHRQADPNWTPPPGHPPGTLTTGAIRFKVAAAGAVIEPVTGIAKTTGKYDLAPGIKLQVTQTSSRAEDGKTFYYNLATIEWYAANGQKGLEWPIQLTAGQYLDPIVWKRGGTAIWIVRGLVVRKIDFTNAADVKETVIKMDEANRPEDAPPEVLQEIVRLIAWQMEQVEVLERVFKLPVPGAEAEAETKDALIITVDKNGAAKLSGEAVTDEQLTAKLAEIAKTRPQQVVVISADQKTLAKQVYRVMEVVGKSGLTKIAFRATKPAEKKTAPETGSTGTSPEGAPAPRRAPAQIVINVKPDGSMVWAGEVIAADELNKRFAEVAKIDRKYPIVVRGEVDTPYNKIVAVLDAAHKAGLHHVSFATTKPDPAAPEPAKKPPVSPEVKPDKPSLLDGPAPAPAPEPSKKTGAQTEINISVAAGGEIESENRNLTLDELRAKLAEAVKAGGKPLLSIRAVNETEFPRISEVLRLAHEAGVKDVVFAEKETTNPKQAAAEAILKEIHAAAAAGQDDTVRIKLEGMERLLGRPGDKEFRAYYLILLSDARMAHAKLFAARAASAAAADKAASQKLREKAVSHLSEAVNLLIQFDLDNKSSLACRTRMGRGYIELARALSLDYDKRDAIQAYKEAALVLTELNREEPNSADHILNLAVIYNEIAPLILSDEPDKDRARMALDYLSFSVTSLRRLLIEQPSAKPQAGPLLAESLLQNSELLLAAGDRTAAFQSCREALDLANSLVSEGKLAPDALKKCQDLQAKAKASLATAVGGDAAKDNGETGRRLALAQGFLESGELEKAREELDAILKLEPAHAAALRLKEVVNARITQKNDPFAVPSDPVALAEARKTSISITVMGADGKKPLPSFRVIAGVRAGSAGGKDTVNWQPHTLHEGRNGGMLWPLDKAYDEMALRVEADGYMPQVFNWIEKKKGPQDLFFQLEDREGLPALVLTPDGKFAAGATIALAMVQRDAVLENGVLRHADQPVPDKPSDRWRWPRVVKTDAEGRALLPAENDPTAALLVVHESGIREMSLKDFLAAKDGAVASGKMAWQIKLQPWARVQGKVQWAGQPGSARKVSLIIHRDEYGYPGIIAQYEKTTTTADGSFVFAKVLPGHVQLSCPVVSDAGSKSGMTEINITGRIAHATLQPGDNTVVIGGGGRPIKGKLTGREKWDGVTFHFHPTAPHIGMPGDEEVWKAWGQFQNSPEGALYFRKDLKVQPDGTFEVPGVLPGDYQIFFKAPGEDKYLSSGKFSLAPESTLKDPKAPEDIGEFSASP